MSKVTYKAIKNMPEVNAYIEQGNRVLGALGYTEHSRGHAVKVAETAGNILDKLGYNQHKIELAKIAGYMHDMGNCVNRVDHAHSSAIMEFQILRDLKVPDEDIAVIVSAIGQHDEATGMAVDAVSAALILADKTDVRRNRVRNTIKESFDNPKSSTALGVAFLAGYGSGAIKVYKELTDTWFGDSTVIKPNQERMKKYERLYEKYEELRAQIMKLDSTTKEV